MASEDEPDADEADEDERDPLVELFGANEEDDRPRHAPSWPGAIGEMAGAALVVLALVAAFIVAAIVLHRIWP